MLYLRKPKESDRAEIQQRYEDSIAIHQPWAYPPINLDAYLTEKVRYFLCRDQSAEIVGTFSISGIVRGYFQSAYLSYEVFSPFERRGYMRAGIKLVIAEAFNSLKLHRLEANIQPENIASLKLVAGAGFVKEGYSKNYLNIGGLGWKDHERWAILNDNWRESAG